jgi:hypothetical protein
MTASAMRARFPVVVLIGALACGRSPDSNALSTDTAAGEVDPDSAVVGATFRGVKYPLTSENYRRWLAAQAALDSLPEPESMPRVGLRDPTDDEIERTVTFLTSHEDERRAIESSGLSVRDFVLTSIALGQAFNFGDSAQVPRENRTFADSNRTELERVRSARRFHLFDDDDDEHGGQDHKHGRDHHHGHGGHGGGHGGHGKHKGND